MNKVTMVLRDLGADGFLTEARNVYLTIHRLNLLGIIFLWLCIVVMVNFKYRYWRWT